MSIEEWARRMYRLFAELYREYRGLLEKGEKLSEEEKMRLEALYIALWGYLLYGDKGYLDHIEILDPSLARKLKQEAPEPVFEISEAQVKQPGIRVYRIYADSRMLPGVEKCGHKGSSPSGVERRGSEAGLSINPDNLEFGISYEEDERLSFTIPIAITLGDILKAALYERDCGLPSLLLDITRNQLDKKYLYNKLLIFSYYLDWLSNIRTA